MDECLAYFRQAVTNPASVPPWSEWWAQNAALVEQVFPLIDYVRLKHRRLLGARQILRNRGELPDDFEPPSGRVTGSCPNCGDRVSSPNGTHIFCPNCGLIEEYHTVSNR
ncbi:hypothetical protein [Limnoglobus roseus]|uniref:Uncharacterized protein n=1 Tax=Limnoglobus roseus TaxID=2598579 RepID=A0A5C1A4T3_9BACT|nr:hypothetical protein [Limnoglobus roseus]QEL13343.1 hypothetical protein PX52LOC_00197 [Limnoglobus roseus]